MAEGPYELPAGWRWVKLGEVCEVIMGQSPPSWTYNQDGVGLPFYQENTDFGELYPTPRLWCSVPKRIAYPGDVLISVRAHFGLTNLANTECAIGYGLAALRPTARLDRFWLLFYLRSIEDKLAESNLESIFTALIKKNLENIRIPLPPLEEQRRIVARIEELMAKVQEAKRLCQEAKEEVDRLWRSGLAEIFPRPGQKLPYGWRWVKLGEISEVIIGQSLPSWTYNQDGIGLPFYQETADFGELYPTPRLWCSGPKKIAYPGDVLISVRAPVGSTNLVNAECGIGQGLAALRPSDRLDCFWLLFYLRSIEGELAKSKTESTFTVITNEDLENIPIPLPPLEQQRRLLVRLKAMQEKVQAFKAAQEEREKELNRLEQAILDKAFRGEL